MVWYGIGELFAKITSFASAGLFAPSAASVRICVSIPSSQTPSLSRSRNDQAFASGPFCTKPDTFALPLIVKLRYCAAGVLDHELHGEAHAKLPLAVHACFACMLERSSLGAPQIQGFSKTSFLQHLPCENLYFTSPDSQNPTVRGSHRPKVE